MTNKELLEAIQESVPPDVNARIEPFLRHARSCPWWNTRGAGATQHPERCSCDPIFLVELYTESDGTADDPEVVLGIQAAYLKEKGMR
jgi:hypothetical protein